MLTSERLDLDIHPLVTESTFGLGKTVALKLADAGYLVYVHGRDAERGAASVAQIQQAGGRARFVRADLGSLSDLDRLVEKVDTVDVLVNNAGSSHFGPSSDLKPTAPDDPTATNVRSTYCLTTCLTRRMIQRRTGAVINVSGMADRIGPAAKAAPASLTRSWLWSSSSQACGSTQSCQARYTPAGRTHDAPRLRSAPRRPNTEPKPKRRFSLGPRGSEQALQIPGCPYAPGASATGTKSRSHPRKKESGL